MLVLGRRTRAMGREIQDNRPRITDHHESPWPHTLRIRTSPRQRARHEKTEGTRMRDDPQDGRRRLRRQGLHRNRLHHHAVRKPEDRELYIREHDYNNQVSSYRAPVERAVAQLKTWRILFTDYRRPLKTFRDSFKAATRAFQDRLRA